MKAQSHFNHMKHHILSAALIAAITAVPALASAAPLSQRTYGNPWAMDFVSNLWIQTNKANIRFRAEHTGTMDKLKLFMIGSDNTQATYCRSAHDCYGGGTGGTIRVTLQTDDGTANHWPSGNVLSTFDIVNPRKNPIYTKPGPPNFAYTPAGTSFMPLLDMPNANLTAGQIYHFVFTNIDPQPDTNWVSIDHIGSDAPEPFRADVIDPLVAIMYRNVGDDWEVYPGNFPDYEVRYTDGRVEGQGHVEARLAPYAVNIYGNNKIRERFTVSGGNRVVSKVSVRVRKVGSPPPLVFTLQKTDGTIIEQGSIPASSVTGTTHQAWASYTFTSNRTLTNGQSYDLILSSTGSSANHYHTHALLSGEHYGWTTWFADGISYKTTNGTTWVYTNGYTDDMQFYFTVAGGGGSPPPPPPPGISVDSTYSGYSTSPIDDGVLNATGGTATTWASADSSTLPHWIEITLPSSQTLNFATIHWAYNDFQSKYMTSQQLQVQTWNGSSWTTAATMTRGTTDVASTTVTFPSTATSRIRFYQPANMGNPTYTGIFWLTEVEYGLQGPPRPSSTYIETGSASSYTDTSGKVWQADQYFTGGSTLDRGARAIANTVDDRIYQTERYGMIGYAIPLANGTYTAKLHFAETSSGITAGQRVFNVSLEGATVLSNFDIYAEAGSNTALIKTFSATVSDGALNIGFTAVTASPEINGIEITR